MKVCMLVPDFDRIGGYEKQAFALSKALKNKGIDVFILTNKMRRDLSSSENREGVFIYRVWPFLGYTRFYRFAMFNALVWFFIRHRGEFNIIHAHALTHLSVLSIFLGKIFGKKSLLKVATAGDITKISRSSLFKSRMLIRLFHYADIFISLSGDIKEEMLSAGVSEDKICSVFNGVNVSKFCPVDSNVKQAKRKQASSSYDKIVLFTGRLVKRKGVDVLLRAWKQVSAKHPQAHLFLLGFGEEMDSLKRLSAEYEINASVSFLGKRDDVLDYFQMADIFVIPSRIEGNPNVLLEALACGLPVVGSSISGIREVIDDRINGILVPPGDAVGLAEKIVFLMNDQKACIKLGQNARESALLNFSLDIISDRYLQLYENLFKQNRDKK